LWTKVNRGLRRKRKECTMYDVWCMEYVSAVQRTARKGFARSDETVSLGGGGGAKIRGTVEFSESSVQAQTRRASTIDVPIAAHAGNWFIEYTYIHQLYHSTNPNPSSFFFFFFGSSPSTPPSILPLCFLQGHCTTYIPTHRPLPR